jgi:2-succinyl-5-enolpyruvyl-6-hydroxy-3-cyclohexene-1-carboxylate synthase
LPGLICHYDPILRQPQQPDMLRPTLVLRLGELPTSKLLRQWLSQLDCEQWIVSDRLSNFDPLHGSSRHLRCDLGELAISLTELSLAEWEPKNLDYRNQWLALEQKTSSTIDQAMAPLRELREPKLPWLLSQVLPEQTPLFIANSTPVRDMEWFWRKGDRQILPYFNRGANGIDGTLSTALGMAHGNRPSVIVTGDLALLHDTNGWLIGPQLRGHLTILLINNNGGGIFELLPIAQFEPPFEQFFATPQSVNFADLCRTYGASYEQITQWEQLETRLHQLPAQGIRLLELHTDRKADQQWRSQLLATAGQTDPS